MEKEQRDLKLEEDIDGYLWKERWRLKWRSLRVLGSASRPAVLIIHENLR